jgi:hypothetical protein
MNSLDFLKQAKLADSLGKYKVADRLLEKAIRLSATPPPTSLEPALDAILREALDKAAKAATDAEARKALLEAGLSEETIDALAKRAGGIRNINTNTIVMEGVNVKVERRASHIFVGEGAAEHQVKLTGLELNQLLAILDQPLATEERNRLVAFIRRYLNRRRTETIPSELAAEINTSKVDYTKPRPERVPRPSETPSETPRPSETPSETPLPEEEAGEGLVEKIKNRFRRKPSEEITELPNQKSKVMKWAKILGATGLAALGLFLYKDKLVDKNGKEINYFDIDLNKIGLPDDTMYKARMEAGQQQPQEPKALAFIEKHKDNTAIKDQRDWYNLALQEYKKENSGKDFDKTDQYNFANDVVAIIKKSDPKTQGFNAGRNA